MDGRKVPEIRFEGFEGEWEEYKLGESVEIVSRTNEQSNAPVMMITAQNGFINQSERYVYDNTGESLKKYILLRRDELAYNHGASKIRPNGSCFALNVEEARVPFVYHCFSVGKNVSEFISFVLNGRETEKQLKKMVSSGARMDGLLNISFEEFCSISLMIPTVVEQKRVARYFRNLDGMLTFYQYKLEKLKLLKRAMIEKMFPKNGEKVPEIRFEGFTDDWEQRKLGDYSELITKGTTPSCFCEDGDVTFVKIEALREKRVVKELCSAISEEIHKRELARSILNEDDIVFAIAGATVGKCAVITGNILPANTNQALAIIRLKTNINRDFVYFSLTSKQMEIYINQSKSIGAQPNLSLAQMNAFEFLCPCQKEEQQKIGDYFSALDHLITLHQDKIEKLHNFKKSMLEKMFI